MGRRSKRLRVRVQTVRLMKRVWLTSVATVLIIAAGISADVALRALSTRNAANDRIMAASSVRVTGTPERSSSERETGALATGVTRTIDLPDLPVPAGTMIDVGVVVTQPFSMAGASLADRNRALQCLTAAIYYEAGSDPDAGQQA
jgi:spore germination cell wall hydrolase CwlJ-like protein